MLVTRCEPAKTIMMEAGGCRGAMEAMRACLAAGAVEAPQGEGEARAAGSARGALSADAAAAAAAVSSPGREQPRLGAPSGEQLGALRDCALLLGRTLRDDDMEALQPSAYEAAKALAAAGLPALLLTALEAAVRAQDE